mmetsp:Transcript_44438/g.92553  ORF Transcript_44438/g.92553 Transcript_44438/m.92553 type:complete len:98 (+) Transcript_44438:2262-2555(+)
MLHCYILYLIHKKSSIVNFYLLLANFISDITHHHHFFAIGVQFCFMEKFGCSWFLAQFWFQPTPCCYSMERTANNPVHQHNPPPIEVDSSASLTASI